MPRRPGHVQEEASLSAAARRHGRMQGGSVQTVQGDLPDGSFDSIPSAGTSLLQGGVQHHDSQYNNSAAGDESLGDVPVPLESSGLWADDIMLTLPKAMQDPEPELNSGPSGAAASSHQPQEQEDVGEEGAEEELREDEEEAAGDGQDEEQKYHQQQLQQMQQQQLSPPPPLHQSQPLPEQYMQQVTPQEQMHTQPVLPHDQVQQLLLPQQQVPAQAWPQPSLPMEGFATSSGTQRRSASGTPSVSRAGQGRPAAASSASTAGLHARVARHSAGRGQCGAASPSCASGTIPLSVLRDSRWSLGARSASSFARGNSAHSRERQLQHVRAGHGGSCSSTRTPSVGASGGHVQPQILPGSTRSTISGAPQDHGRQAATPHRVMPQQRVPQQATWVPPPEGAPTPIPSAAPPFLDSPTVVQAWGGIPVTAQPPSATHPMVSTPGVCQPSVCVQASPRGSIGMPFGSMVTRWRVASSPRQRVPQSQQVDGLPHGYVQDGQGTPCAAAFGGKATPMGRAGFDAGSANIAPGSTSIAAGDSPCMYSADPRLVPTRRMDPSLRQT